jgi:hypothetical protein
MQSPGCIYSAAVQGFMQLLGCVILSPNCKQLLPPWALACAGPGPDWQFAYTRLTRSLLK